MERQAAYAVVQRNAMKVWDEDRTSLAARRGPGGEEAPEASRAGRLLRLDGRAHVDGVFERVLGK